MAKKVAKKETFKDVGSALSIAELRSLSKAKGKSPEIIMSQALKKGIGLGSNVVNQYNKPGGLGSYVYQGTPSNLEPLRGLTIGKGNVYLGSTSYTTPGLPRTPENSAKPGVTTYNPIVSPRSQVRKAPVRQAAAAAPTSTTEAPRSGNPLATQGREMGLRGRELADYVKSQARQANGYVDPNVAAGGAGAMGGGGLTQEDYFQSALNQMQMQAEIERAQMADMYNQQIAQYQNAYEQSVAQANQQAAAQQEAARAFMINQGRSIIPASLQIGGNYGMPQLPGTQAFKAGYRQPSFTAAQMPTAFTAPTFGGMASMTQQPTVLNV